MYYNINTTYNTHNVLYHKHLTNRLWLVDTQIQLGAMIATFLNIF